MTNIKPFDFSTLKDNTFCIYDVKEGQVERIKRIMEELGIEERRSIPPVYYFGESILGYQAQGENTFESSRKHTNSTTTAKM